MSPRLKELINLEVSPQQVDPDEGNRVAVILYGDLRRYALVYESMRQAARSCSVPSVAGVAWPHSERGITCGLCSSLTQRRS